MGLSSRRMFKTSSAVRGTPERTNQVTARLIVSLIALSSFSCHRDSGYGLPITIGMNPDQVSSVLGEPTEHYAVHDKEGQIVRWYYSSGIVGTFDRDHLSRITLNTYTDYHGFLPYSGKVINQVVLTDSKQAIIAKLGNPAKVESDRPDDGTNPDVPVVFPREAVYYWRLKGYLVSATFLNQAQNVSEKQHLVFPKDTLTGIEITK
jgi:hypothetical protein